MRERESKRERVSERESERERVSERENERERVRERERERDNVLYGINTQNICPSTFIILSIVRRT